LQNFLHPHVSRSERAKEENFERALPKKTVDEDSGVKSIAPEKTAEKEELI
jgi:hypothetical protein